MDIIIDQVTDNNDNSLTIIGHDTDGNSYESGMGRKSDLPTTKPAQMAYYQEVLLASIPPTNPILYQTPEYKQKLEDKAEEAKAVQNDTEKGLN